MFVFETRVAVPVASPLAWTWFSMVGIDTGKVCATYSIDGRSSLLITWDPFGSWRSVIPDPGSDGYHFNHHDEWSACTFLSMVGCDDYKILSLTKRHLATAGYDMQMYLLSAGQWSPTAGTPPMIDRLSSGYVVANSCVFWVNSEGRFSEKLVSVVRFGVHVMTINLGQVGRMAWGRYLFIGDPNLTDTPCVKFGRDLLRISHVIRDFDGLESSLDAVASEAQLHSVGVHTLDFCATVVCCSSGFCAARYISGILRIYGLMAVFWLTLDSSLRSHAVAICNISKVYLRPGGPWVSDQDRRVPVSGPFYRAFHYELGDFMMFKDNHGNEFHGFRSMVAAYNIRHGAWLRAYYEGDGTLCISIRNLDGFRIVYPRPHSRSNFTAPTLSSVNPHRTGVLSRDVFHTGDVIPPFSIEYTPPTSPVRSNAFGSPQNSTNSLGCPVYFASTTSQASLVGQILSASLSGFVVRFVFDIVLLPRILLLMPNPSFMFKFNSSLFLHLCFVMSWIVFCFFSFVNLSLDLCSFCGYLRPSKLILFCPRFYPSIFPRDWWFFQYSFLPSLPQTSFQSCWVTRAYLLDIGYVGNLYLCFGTVHSFIFFVFVIATILLANGVTAISTAARLCFMPVYVLGNMFSFFLLIVAHSIHSNLPPAIYPTKGDTYTIQFASTIQNLPMLSLLLEMYLTFVTAFVAEPLDYRAFASMLGHYSFAYPGALHSLLPNSETVVVDKKITKYQADEYILTLPISFVQRAFGTKPDQVDVGDDAGLCYKADVRSKPSRPRECYFARG
ncbi:hypothetical protein AHAS_Ahas17G0251500 [Arachis hypogaea]